MSLQQQSPQQFGTEQMASQRPMTGQNQQGTGGQQTQQTQQQHPISQGQRMEGSFHQSLPPEMQQALQQFFEASNVCEWCAERCVDGGPQMAECLRLCRDVGDLASLNARFIARDSVFGPELAQLFITAARECAQECANHQHDHCQECARVLNQAIQTTQNMLQSFQAMGGGGMQETQGTQGTQTQSMNPTSSQGTQSTGYQQF